MNLIIMPPSRLQQDQRHQQVDGGAQRRLLQVAGQVTACYDKSAVK